MAMRKRLLGGMAANAYEFRVNHTDELRAHARETFDAISDEFERVNEPPGGDPEVLGQWKSSKATFFVANESGKKPQ